MPHRRPPDRLRRTAKKRLGHRAKDRQLPKGYELPGSYEGVGGVALCAVRRQALRTVSRKFSAARVSVLQQTWVEQTEVGLSQLEHDIARDSVAKHQVPVPGKAGPSRAIGKCGDFALDQRAQIAMRSWEFYPVRRKSGDTHVLVPALRLGLSEASWQYTRPSIPIIPSCDNPSWLIQHLRQSVAKFQSCHPGSCRDGLAPELDYRGLSRADWLTQSYRRAFPRVLAEGPV